jgi:hypothetical protein
VTRIRWAIAAATLGLALVAASPSRAALTIGELTPPGSPLGCNAGSVIVQTSTASRSDYRVPPGGGVITEWSAQSWVGGADQFLQLVLAGSDVSDDKVTFEGLSEFERIPSSPKVTPFSFKTRIPVDGGERLGLYGQAGGGFTYTCAYGFSGGSANRIIWGNIPQPVIGGPPVVPANGEVLGERIPMEAKLEPDADKDNFGDETQDQCPTVATTQGPCPAPPVLPSPQVLPAPDTSITKHPKGKTKAGKATFRFTSTVPGSTFECQLDRGAFGACSSPYKVTVAPGRHSLAVRAIANGQTDASPATFKWKVENKPPRRHRHG